MFDFFIEIIFSGSSIFPEKDIFPSEGLKGEHVFHQKTVKKEHVNMVALSKDEQFSSFFDDDEYNVLIYGYCFTRLSSKIKEKQRLYANDVLEIYKTEGKNITSIIKGSYAVLIYNNKNNSIEVFTDELNLRNVYYAQNNGRFILSSALAAFTNYSEKEFSKVNLKSLVEYALFDFDLSDETFIQNVKTLPHASYLQCVNNQISIEEYWNIFSEFENVKPELAEQEAYVVVESILKQNLDMYLSVPDKTAFALTGGYDSRTNLALLDGKHDKGYFYSYGVEESYDIKFAKKVASSLKLNYNAFILEDSFIKAFIDNAEIAINMGDGIAEMTRANYIYVFNKISKKTDYILTGLFGSELIKRPTSLGGYIDKNVQSLLLSNNIKNTFNQIIEKAKKTAFIEPELIEKYRSEIYIDLIKNPYINNKYTGAQKFFFFITGKGIRKYFMKEIKVERAYVENLHPFLDIEFIQLLLKTPFPWLYNWEAKKSLLENLKIHKFYAKLIHDNNKKLSNIPSTHAYKPKYLLKKTYLPFLVMQYAYYRPKIKNAGIFKNENLIWDFYEHKKSEIKGYESVFLNKNIENDYLHHQKEFSKLISLQVWLKNNKISIA